MATAGRAILAFGIEAAAKHRRGRSIEVSTGRIAELLEQIRPRPECAAACREKVVKHVASIKSMREVFDVVPSTAIKTELEKLIYASKKVRGVALQLSPVTRRLMFGDLEYEFLSEELNEFIERAETTYSLIPTKTEGGKPKPLSKIAAAGFARHLIQNYSSFPVTLTKDGRFFRLAALLYETATGERADLTRYCRARR